MNALTRVRALTGAIVVAGTAAGASLAVTAEVARTDGAIRFSASQGGTPLQGSFGAFVSSVAFDPARPEAGSVRVRVDVGSVNAGAASASELLRSADFFDAARFAQASFEASEFHAQGPGTFLAKGVFTLKGHAVTLPVTFTAASDARGRWFDGSFTISRLAFQVGLGEWSDTSTLDDAVQVQFHLLQAVAAT